MTRSHPRQIPRLRPPALACLLGALALGIAPSVPRAAAQTPPQAVIVVDGSNSMWAQIDGTAKIGLARDAILSALRDTNGALHAGVTVYGGRSSSDCTDISAITPVGPVDLAATETALDAVRPQGATPHAAVLEQASGQLTDGPASIILIADGSDNCGGDPCAAAAALAQARPGLAVHVIGFSEQGDAETDLAGLACMSQATGGTFTVTKTGPDLTAALVAAATAAIAGPEVRTVALPTAETDTTPDTAETAEAPTGTAEVETDGKAGGSHRVVTANGIPLPPIRPDRPDPSDPIDLTATAAGAVPPPQLPTAEDGNLAAPPVFDDADERPRRPVRLWAQVTEDTGALSGDLIWRVYALDPLNASQYQLVDSSDEPNPVFSLPDGDYVVHVAFGRAQATSRIAVSGGAVEQPLVLDAGGLRVMPVGAAERELAASETSISVFSSEQDEYGQRRLILRDMPQGAIVRLNAGTYHIVSRYGDANAIVRADVRVQPGLLTDARIYHEAATITLKLVTETGGEALANTAWSILSPGGDIVKESFGAFPTHVLAAGEYSIIARHEGQLYNREFSVSAGEVREVELLAE